MTYALIAEYRLKFPEAKISIIVSPGCDLEGFDSLKVAPMEIWGKDYLLDSEPLNDVSSLVAVGADVMDGHYWPISVLRTLELCEQARIKGIQVGILGFSFNKSPDHLCVKGLQRLNSDIRLFARDPISKQRFETSVSPRIKLVADAAFCMHPNNSSNVAPVVDWCKMQVKMGHAIVGFNLHSLLFNGSNAPDIGVAMINVAESLIDLLRKENVSVLLIPHDYRGKNNDKELLRTILSKIPSELNNRLLLPEFEFNADELKSITSNCRIVLTGRMHLAIASLGMGIPVGVVSYQDKFEGLFEHFGLPSKYIITPETLSKKECVFEWMHSSVLMAGTLQDDSKRKLPAILNLSKNNFSWLT